MLERRQPSKFENFLAVRHPGFKVGEHSTELTEQIFAEKLSAEDAERRLQAVAAEEHTTKDGSTDFILLTIYLEYLQQQADLAAVGSIGH